MESMSASISEEFESSLHHLATNLPRHPSLRPDILTPKHVQFGKVSTIETTKDTNEKEERNLSEMPIFIISDLEENNLSSSERIDSSQSGCSDHCTEERSEHDRSCKNNDKTPRERRGLESVRIMSKEF